MVTAGTSKGAKTAGTSLRRVLSLLEDTVFPPQCGGCRRRGTWLCPACAARLRAVPEPLCTRCGSSLASESSLCSHPPGWPDLLRVRGVYVFDGPLREAIHRFKYGDEHARAHSLAALLLESPQLRSGDYDLVAHVPLHSRRRRKRGYDQALLLAREISKQMDIPLARGLARVVNTRSQVGLSREQRLENVRGSFAWRGEALDGASVLLIDDVVTTGATMLATGEALLEGGARRVDGLALARPVGVHGPGSRDGDGEPLD